MPKVQPKDYPAYAAELARNIHRTKTREEVEKILAESERGFNKSLYGLDYYLKKELKRRNIEL